MPFIRSLTPSSEIVLVAECCLSPRCSLVHFVRNLPISSYTTSPVDKYYGDFHSIRIGSAYDDGI